MFYYTNFKCTCLNLPNMLKICKKKTFGQRAIFFWSTCMLVNWYSTTFNAKAVCFVKTHEVIREQ